MFKTNAANINNNINREVVKMMEKKEMFAMTRISAVESESFALGCFVISESQGEISDATAPFVRNDKTFRATTDSMPTTRRHSSEQIIELSMMFDENRTAESLLNVADYAVFRGAKGVEVYVRLNAVAYTKSHKPFLRPMSSWYHVTGKLVTTEDALFTYQQVEDIPKTARIFTPWQRVNSTSQGRKSLMYAFSTTQKRFDRIRDEVTVGMTPKYDGEVVTADKQADYTTRASSHDTFAKGKNILLESYVVLFGKLDGTDGNIIANGACFEKNAQIRPVTMKGHTLKLPEHRFDQFVAMKNLRVLLRSEISDDDEKYLDIMLDKGAKAVDKDAAKAYFAGFDGVLICDNLVQKIQLIADQNACKAKFNYRRTDYIHVLAEADHCGDDQKLSMQLAKILLQAGAENGSKAYQEAKDLLIANAIQSVRGTFAAHKEPVRTLSWNSGLIDANTPISLLSGILGFDVQKYPYLLRHDLEDKLSRISRDICRLNFKIQGLYLPVAPDVAAWFDLRVLKTTKRYVEVYVPGKTGYAVLLKYPSTGNNEFIVVKFLSLEEVLANIAALDTSDEIKALIADVYKSIEEGIAIVSSDPVVRHMLAGFDFDGDHALFVTDEKFVNFMRQYGQPIAVYIQEPDVDDALERVMITSMSFALHAANMAKTGNKRVGQVVNLGRFFTNALTALMAHDSTKAQRELMLNVMRKVFFNKNKFHGAKYRSLFAREEVDGIPTVNVRMNTVNYVIQSASVMALTRKNVLAWLRDMDHVFRFYSELTIDAQKKLYSVAIKFAKYMKKAGFRISSNVYGMQFDIVRDENNASLIKEVVLHDDVLLRDVVMRPTKNGPEGKWIGDVFTPIRRAAVDEVLTQCSVLVEQYNTAVQKAEEERQIRQMQYLTQTRDGLFNAINLFGRFDSAMGRMVRVENYDRIMKTQLGNRQIRIPANIANALRTELHRGVKADFFDLAEELTNTYRRIAKDRSYSELAERILAITRGDRMVSDICHEELMKYFLDAENIRYRCRIKLFDDVTADMVDDVVTVSDGMAHSYIGQLGRVGNDIEDGVYSVEIENEDAYIIEMASSRIEVPEADESRFVVFFEGEAADSVKKYLDENEVACFVKSNDGKFVHMRNGDNTKKIGIVVTNSFTTSGMALPSSAMYMNLIAGKQVRVIASKYVRAERDRNGYQTHSQQMLLVCEELGVAPAAPQKKKQTQSDDILAILDLL